MAGQEKDITPHIPVFNKSNRTDGTFSPRRLRLRRRTRPLHAPGGQRVVQFRRTYAIPRSGVTAEGHKTLSRQQIGLRHLQTQSPVLSERPRPQDPAGSARRRPRRGPCALRAPQCVEACRLRKKVEMLFAHLKRILRLARLRLRGPNGAKDEFLLAATAQNPSRLAGLRPINRLPEMLAA
jgi:hypothetical protein